MTDIPFGTVVLTDFPFTDLSSSKRRPALVVSADNGRRGAFGFGRPWYTVLVEHDWFVPLITANA